MSPFERATVIPGPDTEPVYKWMVVIDNTLFLCTDLMEVGAVLISYPENKNKGIRMGGRMNNGNA